MPLQRWSWLNALGITDPVSSAVSFAWRTTSAGQTPTCGMDCCQDGGLSCQRELGRPDRTQHPVPRQGVPPIPAGVQDHSFHTQAVFEIQREIGKLEVGLETPTNRLSNVETKLSGVSIQLTELTTQISTLKPIFVWAVGALWAAAGSLFCSAWACLACG